MNTNALATNYSGLPPGAVAALEAVEGGSRPLTRHRRCPDESC
jgi:hypothetical protein